MNSLMTNEYILQRISPLSRTLSTNPTPLILGIASRGKLSQKNLPVGWANIMNTFIRFVSCHQAKNDATENGKQDGKVGKVRRNI